LELTQKSERTIQDLEAKVSSLEREVASNNAGVEEVTKEHKSEIEVIRNEKALVEVQLHSCLHAVNLVINEYSPDIIRSHSCIHVHVCVYLSVLRLS